VILDDELVEVTPSSLRVRKRRLAEHDRRRAATRATRSDDVLGGVRQG
jgi:predicted membrane GTPase involved in stress response